MQNVKYGMALVLLLALSGCGGSDSGGASPTPLPTVSVLPNPSSTPAVTPTPTVSSTPLVTPTPTVTPSPIVTPTPEPVAYTVNPHEQRFFGDQDLSLFWELFDHDKLTRIDVTMSQTEWDAFIAAVGSNPNTKTYFNADVSITTESGTTTITNVGFRIRGNTTRRLPEAEGEYRLAHFKIKFNETFDLDEGSVQYLFQKDRRFANLQALNLKSPTITADVPHMRELFAYDLFNQVGVNAPLVNTSRLFLHIGDETIDYGVYTMGEPIDKTFLRKRFGDINNEGNLYKCLWQSGGPATLEPFDFNDGNKIGLEDNQGFKPSYDLKTNKSALDHSEMQSFVDAINTLEGAEFQSYINQNFEIDKFLRMLAVNVLVGMPDDYWGMGNNYYLYFNTTGMVEMFPWDYDHTFGQGWRPVDTAQVNVFDWWNGVSQFIGNDTPRPLIAKIMAVDSFRQQYEQYLSGFIADGIFTYGAFEEKYAQIKALIDPDDDGEVDGEVIEIDHQINLDNLEGYSVQGYYQLRTSTIEQQLAN